MQPNPILGVFLHWLGGLASASFYVPYRKVKGWSWETYWLAGGIVSWILAPWVMAWLLTRDLFAVLHHTSPSVLWWTFFFGVLWGMGGLTFGLTMRYLGLSLGMAVALGYTAVFGTLVPPLFAGVPQAYQSSGLGACLDEVGHNWHGLMETRSGVVIVVGVGICVLGIIFGGLAGISKERELSPEAQKAAIPEFSLKLGLLVATFCGVMSACMAFGLSAGESINELTMQHGTAAVWSGLPVLIVVLAGGFTTNFVWCAILNVRNRSYGEYARMPKGAPAGSSQTMNYILSAVAGFTWYLQFFFYTMGESQMGKKYMFSSWTLHMASIIIFSTLWGIALHEWRGVGARTKTLIFLTLLVLVSSTAIVGYGNYLSVH
ncbi:MAG TPA: L-rhamnose/proton symporter RhaT [Acidobacteriaceae bacterium]|nr:L-rhamnose/proton symporter RhaT [Acidobacteriaceae bacterium]